MLAFIASFAAVLAVGLAGGWIGGSGDGASPTGIFWHRVEPDFVLVAGSGPGGFVATGRPAELGVWLSADGVSWAQSSLPAGEGAFVESILSTTDGWLITGGKDEAHLAWWSEDGRNWSQVDWPIAFENSIQTIISSGEYFFVLSNDVFDEGTTLWRSSDGLTWTHATLESPSELGEGNLRVVAVERLGNRWMAFIEVERVDQDPVLAVLSSANGESWEFESSLPFRFLDSLGPGVQTRATIGDRLVAASVGNFTQIWSTTDGSEWALELSEDQHLIHVDGAIVEGRPTGIWIGLGGETEETVQTPVVTTTPSVVTTTAAMPDEPVDPDGLEFQANVTEDGTVTFEEFEQAAEHWKTCMEEHGVTDVEYTIDRSGGFGASYASPSPQGDRESAISNLCDESWLNQVAAVLATQAGN
jgi:hypothetical protein